MINNIFKNLSVVVLISILGINGFSQTRIIHIYVALCDNESQGIVPVPKKIGNGNDPDNHCCYCFFCLPLSILLTRGPTYWLPGL